MIKHKPFLRWLLFATLVSVGVYFVNKTYFFNTLLEKDFTMLSFVIIVAFVFVSLVLGYRTRKIGTLVRTDNGFFNRRGQFFDLNDYASLGWFTSAICTSLGMIGTVWGFIEAFKGFVGLDTNDPTMVKNTVAYLTIGVNAALYTTFVGLICSVLLKIQSYHLEFSIKEFKN